MTIPKTASKTLSPLDRILYSTKHIKVHTHLDDVACALSPIPTKLRWERLSLGTLFNGGWHGTTKESLGDQLKKGEFENRGKKIYFDTLAVAASYALRRAGEGETPVIVRISSVHRSKCNKITVDGWGTNLGLYRYFEGKDVRILKAYAIEREVEFELEDDDVGPIYG